MAKSFGASSNYALTVSQKNQRYFLMLLVAIAVIAHLAGFTAGLAIMSPVISYIPLCLLIALLWVAERRVVRILEELQTAAIAFRKCADGMTLTADALGNLPDTYSIFHDFSHPSLGGNIGHIVVGPTGVFALAPKDWRGMVTLSGPGILTLDSKYDQTPVVENTLGHAKNLKQKIPTLANIEAFVQAVLVFPHASVYVLPGTRCTLDVQRLDRLMEYITKPVATRQLTPPQVEAVTRDLQALYKQANT